MNNQRDSTTETLLHIKRVSELLNNFAIELIKRGNKHDNTKLEEPEKSYFDNSVLLKNLKFGSDEYNKSLEDLKIALKHHYENNSHHPQHYKNGIDDFDLYDLIEMALDWLAATERTSDGNILESIEINKERFNISPQICKIFQNTFLRMK